MPRLPRLTGAELAAAFRRLGFPDHHQRGSHLVMFHPDGRRAVIPQHGSKVLKAGTVHRILREARVGLDELLAVL